MMKQPFKQILYTNQELTQRIRELAQTINQDYKDCQNVIMVPIMDGALVFAGQLLLELDIDVMTYSTKISSYSFNTTSSKEPKILTPFTKELVQNKDIILVDDMIDTGHTLSMFIDYLKNFGARSVKVCVLFEKEVQARDKHVFVDYVGFKIPNQWVAGFGIDSKEKLRNCKDFGIVDLKQQ
ncbi:phosphoribosyltransferase [Ureaplasma ceti]|uniref:Hypoxanthine-guanine phosphoribosyltransferase n=1 Tax=Ureaplasma ceti TaxID=3119530 RepID=A0ABP9U8B2_9BACT